MFGSEPVETVASDDHVAVLRASPIPVSVIKRFLLFHFKVSKDSPHRKKLSNVALDIKRHHDSSLFRT